MVVVNKIDVRPPDKVLRQLAAAADLDLSEYFPVSARTGAGVPELVDAPGGSPPRGPQLYPDDMVTDVPEAFWVAELVREQLLAVAARGGARTRSPPGSPSGSGPASAARSWSSASPRRAS